MLYVVIIDDQSYPKTSNTTCQPDVTGCTNLQKVDIRQAI